MITEFLINIAINIITAMGYPGIFLVMAAESFMVPVPPEITVVFSGYLASAGKLNIIPVIVWSVAGALTGSTFAYWVGYHFKKTIVKKLIERHGHFLVFTQYELEETKELFKKHGPWIIFVSRFIPGIRSVVSLPLGILHIPFRQFITYTAVGTLISTSMLTYLGLILNDNWTQIRVYLHKFDILIIFFLIMILGVYIYKRHKKQKGDQKT